MDDPQYIVTFPSTHTALSAEKAAKAAEMRVKMIPVPRTISAGCNMGMRVTGASAETISALLSDAGIDFSIVHIPD